MYGLLVKKIAPAVLLAVFLIALVVLGQSKLGLIEPASQEIIHECVLNSDGCPIILKGNTIASARVMEPDTAGNIRVTVEFTKGQSVKPISLQLEGRDMFMGVSQYELYPSSGSMVAEFPLPFCTIDNDMVWLFKFAIKGVDPRLVFAYPAQPSSTSK